MFRVIFQFKTKTDKNVLINRIKSLRIHIRSQSVEKVETEKFSLTQQQPFRPVTVQNPQQTPATDAGKINISQITRGRT
jgi:hypothetical protein